MPRHRSLPSWSPYLVSDLYGNHRRVGVYKREGQVLTADFRDFDERASCTARPTLADSFPPRGLSPYILGRIRGLLAAYEQSGQFSATELRTMDALLYEGLSLRELASREGVTDQAVRARLVGRRGRGGLLKKTPEFARWWRFACSWRQRGGRRP